MGNEQKLRNAFESVLNVPIDENVSVENTPEWDSLHHLTLILVLEESFGVSFTESEVVDAMSYPAMREALGEHGIIF